MHVLLFCTCYGLFVTSVTGAATGQLITRELGKKPEPEGLPSGHAFTETIQHPDGRITVQVHYRDPDGALGRHIFELNHVKSTKVEEDPKKKRKFINNNPPHIARQTRNKLIKEAYPPPAPRLRRPAPPPPVEPAVSYAPSAAHHHPRFTPNPSGPPPPVFTPVELDPQSLHFANTPAVHNVHFDPRLTDLIQPQYNLAYQDQLPIHWPPEDPKYVHRLPSYAQIMYDSDQSIPHQISNGEIGYSYINFFRDDSNTPVSSVQVIRGNSAPNYIPWQQFLRPHLVGEVHNQHFSELSGTSLQENYKQATSENTKIAQVHNATEIVDNNNNKVEENFNSKDGELENPITSNAEENIKDISEEETRKIEKTEPPNESVEEGTTTITSTTTITTTTPVPSSTLSSVSLEESENTSENDKTSEEKK